MLLIDSYFVNSWPFFRFVICIGLNKLMAMKHMVRSLVKNVGVLQSTCNAN